jgi:hypothetical protein
MHDAGCVGRGETARDVGEPTNPIAERDAGVADEGAEWLAIDELHGDEWRGVAMDGAVDLSDFVDGDDVGVIERGGGAGLAEEARGGERVVFGWIGIGLEDLERDAASEVRIARGRLGPCRRGRVETRSRNARPCLRA